MEFRVRDLILIFDLLPVSSWANYITSMTYSSLTCKLDLCGFIPYRTLMSIDEISFEY